MSVWHWNITLAHGFAFIIIIINIFVKRQDGWWLHLCVLKLSVCCPLCLLLSFGRCLTLSNPVPWQNWMAAYLGYTLRMRTLFRGWPIMVNDTHTRRRRFGRMFIESHLIVSVLHCNLSKSCYVAVSGEMYRSQRDSSLLSTRYCRYFGEFFQQSVT